MKVRSVQFDDDEDPKTCTVDMSMDELALIYAFMGYVAPKVISDAGGDSTVFNNLAMDLSRLFNQFWEDGWDDIGPRRLAAVIKAKFKVNPDG